MYRWWGYKYMHSYKITKELRFEIIWILWLGAALKCKAGYGIGIQHYGGVLLLQHQCSFAMHLLI